MRTQHCFFHNNEVNNHHHFLNLCMQTMNGCQSHGMMYGNRTTCRNESVVCLEWVHCTRFLEACFPALHGFVVVNWSMSSDSFTSLELRETTSDGIISQSGKYINHSKRYATWHCLKAILNSPSEYSAQATEVLLLQGPKTNLFVCYPALKLVGSRPWSPTAQRNQKKG